MRHFRTTQSSLHVTTSQTATSSKISTRPLSGQRPNPQADDQLSQRLRLPKPTQLYHADQVSLMSVHEKCKPCPSSSGGQVRGSFLALESFKASHLPTNPSQGPYTCSRIIFLSGKPNLDTCLLLCLGNSSIKFRFRPLYLLSWELEKLQIQIQILSK